MALWDKFKLDGKLAVVTGGSRGLGREMALALAEAGASLLITGREQETLNRTADDIRRLGVNCATLSEDMAAPEACEAAFNKIIKDFGLVDILINNIGGRTGPEPTEELTLARWQEAIGLNLTSCFLGTKIIGAELIKEKRPGSIINISSMSGMIANRDIGGRSYEASKAAVLHFTRTAAADWAPYGIRVNAICPGLFMTDANEAWKRTKPEVIDKLIALTPMGRPGSPHELGPLAVFLASDASSYVTGAAHVIDGGYTLW